MSRRLLVLLLVSASIGFVLPTDLAFAQTSVISGVVRDSDGMPIVGATVTAENDQFRRSAETTTNDAGRFSMVGLQGGQWLFIVKAIGFRPVQGVATMRRSGNSGRLQFEMEPDPFNPPPPNVGALAGIRALEIQADLSVADQLFDTGNYERAIEAYAALLKELPILTSLNLLIGHAHRERQEYDAALAAYREIPAGDPASREAEAAISALALMQSGH